MQQNASNLVTVAERLAARDDVLLERMLSPAVEIVFFGSRAQGVNSRSSDLDVLCIGRGQRLKSAHLDIIWKRQDEAESVDWLSSELAGHIAEYGVWFLGRGDWRGDVRIGELAVNQKEQRIIRLSESLHTHWSKLHLDFQQKYLTIIRREVQRLEILRQGSAVPPTPLLDERWRSDQNSASDWSAALRRIKPPELSARARLHGLAEIISGSTFTLASDGFLHPPSPMLDRRGRFRHDPTRA
jgi:predicted nucleotidyltransferase